MSDPKRKIAGFLAALLLLGALLFRYFFAPLLTQIPDDFYYTAELSSQDNFYDELANMYLGASYSVTQLSYQVQNVSPLGLEIKNSFSVETTDGAPIFSTDRLYGIDPKTGAHVQGLGDEDRSGYLFAPRNLKEGEGYTYWHVNYDAPAEMEYVDTVDLYGLTVFHYETYFEGQNVDQTASLSYLPTVPESEGIRLQPHLETWVEPVTGMLVNYQDDTTAYYYDLSTGEISRPWNHFQNTFTEESVQAHVSDALNLQIRTIFFEKILPIILLIFAIGFFILAHLKTEDPAKKRKGVAFGITLFMTLGPIVAHLTGWYLLQLNMQKQVRLVFQDTTENIEGEIVKQMETYINTLRGTTGLFAASQNVERDEWDAYVLQLNLAENYPGASAIGFAKVVTEAEKADFESAVRLEGTLPDYAIYPSGERNTYAPVLYLKLATPEDQAFEIYGYDMYYDTARSQAITLARDTGDPTLSGRVVLYNDLDDKIGFLIFVPVYKNNLPHDTLEERRENILGYTYSPFRVNDLMGDILGSSDLPVSFELYDGVGVSKENLLYDSTNTDPNTEMATYQQTKTETTYIAGHPLTFHFTSQKNLDLSSKQNIIVWGTLVIGLVLAALAVFIYFSLLISRQRFVDSYGLSGRRRKI